MMCVYVRPCVVCVCMCALLLIFGVCVCMRVFDDFVCVSCFNA